MKILLLMLAGGLGAGARYAVTIGVQTWLVRTLPANAPAAAFPVGTLLINVAGSLMLAFLITLVLEGAVHPDYRIVIGTGFLGAFTTFSTFAFEAEAMLTRGLWLQAVTYIFGNLFFGLLAIIVGRVLALRVFGLLS